MSNWESILVVPAKAILVDIGQFLVNVLVVLVILIAGWLIARVIQKVVTKGLRVIKLDDLSDKIELDSLMAKGGIGYSLSELIGIICYWLAMLVTFIIAINAVGLTMAADLLNRVVLYIPNIIAAIFILVIGMFVSTLLRNIVQAAANNAGLDNARFLAKVVDVSVMVFAAILALEQLGIGRQTISLIISIVLGSLGLGIALAFGLGCKDLVGKTVSDFVDKIKKK